MKNVAAALLNVHKIYAWIWAVVDLSLTNELTKIFGMLKVNDAGRYNTRGTLTIPTPARSRSHWVVRTMMSEVMEIVSSRFAQIASFSVILDSQLIILNFAPHECL